MPTTIPARWVYSFVTLLSLALPMSAAPEANGLGDPGTLQTLAVETGRGKDRFLLDGRDSWQQLLVTGRYSSGQTRDLTQQVKYRVEPDGIVAVDDAGLVTPLKEGEAVISAKAEASPEASVRVSVTHLVNDVPVSLANQVIPIFTKFGCNSGGCHGKASGQNGFKLSLLGFEPAEDYEYLVKEARGRRVFPAAPASSLLLLKATGGVAHGGGKRLEVGSPYYTVIRRWIEQGTPKDKLTDPVVQRIEVLPKERLLERGGQQQLAVVAHLSDGSTIDVTRMTQFEPNRPEMALVSPTGLVSAQKLPGSVAVMARYQSHVDVFRATVPLGAPVESLPPAKNFIDELVYKKLKELGLPPSVPCDDATFLRRATIDIAGRLPTLEETRAFLADKDAGKYDKLIDRLLDGPDYVDYFANKWSAVLRNRRRGPADDPKPTAVFHEWIRDQLRQNKPYDQFVRGVLTATGKEGEVAPVVWYREVKEPAAQMEDVAQLFLGQRLGCAKCHHHPFEKWSQHDYWGMSAFFAKVVVTDAKPAKKAKNKETTPAEPASLSLKNGPAQMTNLRTGKPVKPTELGGKELALANDEDPREKLADWMAAPENPFFARTLANRYWKHFFSRGLVDPEDDMRVTNPASNPELLDALAKYFVEHKYDLKDLVRTMATSQVYRISAVPNAFNADDKQNHSRFMPKRLNAEVLLDAVDIVTGSKTTFKGVPPGTRAVQLPDNQFDSYFLSVFGRPDSASACECERSGDASLAQCLHMFNSAELLDKIGGTAKGGGKPRAAQLAEDQRPHEDKLKEIYLLALSREPSKDELTALLAHIEKKKGSVRSAYEDIVWALLNTKEFLFNH